MDQYTTFFIKYLYKTHFVSNLQVAINGFLVDTQVNIVPIAVDDVIGTGIFVGTTINQVIHSGKGIVK